jgi:hypothetical protein
VRQNLGLDLLSKAATGGWLEIENSFNAKEVNKLSDETFVLLVVVAMFTRGLCAIRSLDTDIADEGLKLEVFVFD